jgi:hypothetical protein
MRLLTAIAFGIVIGVGGAVLAAARDQEHTDFGTIPTTPVKEAEHGRPT